MEIKLLNKNYKNNESFYECFKNNELMGSEFVSEKSIWIPGTIPDFPIYFSGEYKNGADFLKTINVIDKNVINLERDYYMDGIFWHSLLCLYKRDYLIRKYPEIMESEEAFNNIVIKPFNWENYIYKSILIAQYVADNRCNQKEKYYKLILSNMDIFNYIIKYEIFRNGTFLINIMDIIDETGLSSKLKEKIKNRPDLGPDERYGRRVIYELNKSYPIVMSPMLEKDELKEYFLKYLMLYTNEKKDDDISKSNISVVKDDTSEEDESAELIIEDKEIDNNIESTENRDIKIGDNVIIRSVDGKSTKTISVNFIKGTKIIPTIPQLLIGRRVGDKIKVKGKEYIVERID